MGKITAQITDAHKQFIASQKLFFVGTAAAKGTVNVSPKGMDSLRVLSPNRVIWLNVTGSGNETAAHLLENDRMTLMFCAFEGKPLILRLYGTAKAYHPRDAQWEEFIHLFPALPGSRQLFDLEIDTVQSSCGMAVPLMDYQGDRHELNEWATKQGEEGIAEYWSRKNRKSIDGFETSIFDTKLT
ncbi:pyridoxamine 5'-phosphate oxidase [Dyadobacter jejuensis]|uniref:Pyridoxamine 5'-phosphate oxidase n=1 Tax=Dyadobacter jejuensis TaxID=1082580 RepID=A0A316AD67_9BACT|nr:pyridoxamine 5'-phosphate oxidase family protein [Dyadobacter jejuensis]PWJ55552.1 pyridoxamine 5'-phosphate oxidase [Dyadobacter jejuensis]